MPKRRYKRRELTHDWQQIRPLLKDSAQITYEVLFSAGGEEKRICPVGKRGRRPSRFLPSALCLSLSPLDQLLKGGSRMPDVYANITTADLATQQRLAEVIELRAADAQQRAMLTSSLSQIDFPQSAQVLEVGCGTGVVMRQLSTFPAVTEVTGVDLSPVFLAKASALAADLPHLRFIEADGRTLPFSEQSFDVVVFHTTLCHLPEPERALAEAFRVLKPLGQLSVFDGDYATMTVQTSPFDPLQTCLDATRDVLLHDPWLVRRLSSLLRDAGFVPEHLRSYGYVAQPPASYMLTLVDRGADTLAATGRIRSETATALKAEAQSRVEAGTFFGYIAYASLIAHRPAA